MKTKDDEYLRVRGSSDVGDLTQHHEKVGGSWQDSRIPAPSQYVPALQAVGFGKDSCPSRKIAHAADSLAATVKP